MDSRKYNLTNDETRSKLIHAVFKEKRQPKDVAQELGIKVSTAKAIINVYKKEGRSSKKHKRDRKELKIINNIFFVHPSESSDETCEIIPSFSFQFIQTNKQFIGRKCRNITACRIALPDGKKTEIKLSNESNLFDLEKEFLSSIAADSLNLTKDYAIELQNSEKNQDFCTLSKRSEVIRDAVAKLGKYKKPRTSSKKHEKSMFTDDEKSDSESSGNEKYGQKADYNEKSGNEESDNEEKFIHKLNYETDNLTKRFNGQKILPLDMHDIIKEEMKYTSDSQEKILREDTCSETSAGPAKFIDNQNPHWQRANQSLYFSSMYVNQLYTPPQLYHLKPMYAPNVVGSMNTAPPNV